MYYFGHTPLFAGDKSTRSPTHTKRSPAHRREAPREPHAQERSPAQPAQRAAPHSQREAPHSPHREQPRTAREKPRTARTARKPQPTQAQPRAHSPVGVPLSDAVVSSRRPTISADPHCRDFVASQALVRIVGAGRWCAFAIGAQLCSFPGGGGQGRHLCSMTATIAGDAARCSPMASTATRRSSSSEPPN